MTISRARLVRTVKQRFILAYPAALALKVYQGLGLRRKMISERDYERYFKEKHYPDLEEISSYRLRRYRALEHLFVCTAGTWYLMSLWEMRQLCNI